MNSANDALGKGCLSVFARVIVVRIAAFAVVFVIGSLSLVMGLIVGAYAGAVWGVATAAVLFFVVIFGGGNAFLVFSVLRRKMLLDRAFLPLGLNGRMYRLVFRRYEGTVAGRKVEVFFHRGPILEVLLESTLKARAGITLDYGDTAFLADLLDRQPLKLGIQGLEDVKVWAEDEVWARGLIQDQRGAARLRQILDDRAFFIRNHVKIMPGYIHLQFSGNQNVMQWSISPEQAAGWLNSLAAFAEFAEIGIPAPARQLELSRSEELVLSIKRKDTSKFTIYFAIGLIGFFIVVSVIVAILVAIMAAFSK
jgi:hypothetical protein